MQKIILCIALSFSCIICSSLLAADENLYTSATHFKSAGNLREYVKVCKRAASFNQPWALNEMGVIYQFGLSDTVGKRIILKDINRAIEYYQQAVTQYPAFALAQENLERAQEQQLAAQQAAQKILAEMEEVGDLVTRDIPLEEGYRTPPSQSPIDGLVPESPSGLTTGNATADNTPVKTAEAARAVGLAPPPLPAH